MKLRISLIFLSLLHLSAGERTKFNQQRLLAETEAKTEAETEIGQAVKPPSEVRLAYVAEKIGIELEVVSQFTSAAETIEVDPQPRPEKQKVAFLFLAMTDLLWNQLWENFFATATPGDYSIYVHRAAAKFQDPQARKEQDLPLAKFGAIEVPWVKTAWCALFGVEVASLTAALQDPANTQFVFVSDSTVPLKRFDYIYKQLIVNSPSTSKFCVAEPAQYREAQVQMAIQEAKRSCVFLDYLRNINPRVLKHHQWAVLARQHAAAVVRQAIPALELYKATWPYAATDIPGGLGEGCSDESVPLTALLYDLEVKGKSTNNTWIDLTRLGVEMNCLTYVNWRNCFADTELSTSNLYSDLVSLFKNKGEVLKVIGGMIQPELDFDFLSTALKRDLNGFPTAFQTVDEAYLRKMVSHGFMFARKFNTGMTVKVGMSEVPLEEILPRLWDGVDEHKAQSLTWSHVATTGNPSSLGKP